MLDINKAVNELEARSSDPDGNLYGLEAWSRGFAKQQASDEGLGELSDVQWRIIYTLRGMYRKHGRATSARQVIRRLEDEFADEGGRGFLYRAFPQGPVSQGSRLAGVPPPPYARDGSFGSVI